MKKLVALVFLLSTVGLGSAGHKINRKDVSITTTSASGSLGSARASADMLQYIGCYVYGNEAYNFRSVTCYARNEKGVTATCYTDNPAIVDVASSLNGDSYLRFVFSGSRCITIRVDNMSYEAPKQ